LRRSELREELLHLQAEPLPLEEGALVHQPTLLSIALLYQEPIAPVLVLYQKKIQIVA
jgi:hypothetical protein